MGVAEPSRCTGMLRVHHFRAAARFPVVGAFAFPMIDEWRTTQGPSHRPAPVRRPTVLHESDEQNMGAVRI